MVFLTIALAVLIAIVYALIAWAKKQKAGSTVAQAALNSEGDGSDLPLDRQSKEVDDN